MNQPSSFLSQPGRQGAFFPTSLSFRALAPLTHSTRSKDINKRTPQSRSSLVRLAHSFVCLITFINVSLCRQKRATWLFQILVTYLEVRLIFLSL